MSHNSRFTVALHVLTLLAYCGEKRLTSEFISGSVNTNAVVIRRLLKSLRAARLVASQGGPGGGWRLARTPQGITLRDIYLATEGEALFPMPAQAPNSCCPVGATIQSALAKHFADARHALEMSLGNATIADLLKEIQITPER